MAWNARLLAALEEIAEFVHTSSVHTSLESRERPLLKERLLDSRHPRPQSARQSTIAGREGVRDTAPFSL
jgi:hypothetical protein